MTSILTKSLRKAIAFSLVALTAVECMVAPAFAQTTILSGKVNSSAAMPQLVRQQPVYDTVRVTTPRPATTLRSNTRTVVVEKPVYREVYVRDNRTYFQKHPKVKAVTLGAGIGAGAGAVTGLVSGRGVVRGAAIGAGSGAGVGLVRSSRTMKRHPIVRDTATGTIAGLGVGMAASRNSRRAWQGAGVGAAVGLGYGLYKNLR